MNDLSIAFLTIFGTVASVTGVVLYVFNGTKILIKEIHETQRKVVEMMEIAQQQHQDMIELLKMGFGIAGARK